MQKPRSHRRLLLSALVASAITSTAGAQGVLEEIVVTAQKRAQDLQDVPISIQAYTGEYLEDFNLAELQLVAVRTPNMAFSRAGGEAQIYIRGIGTNIFGVGVDPSVAVHQDGVYFGRTNMALTQLLDIERVEILRGPQGTLYGRNTTGGAINLISRMPSDEPEGYVEAQIGNFSHKEISAAYGGPINDQWGFRVAGRWSDDDGFTDDLDPAGENEIDDQQVKAIRGILTYTPTDRFRLSVIADRTEFDSGNRAIRPLDDLGAAEVLGSLPLGDFDETRNNLDTFFDWDMTGATVNAEVDLSDTWTLTSVTGYRKYESDFLFNTDGTEIDITRSNFKYDSEQFSQEWRIASNGIDRWNFIGGVYYLHENKAGALGLVRAGGRPFFATVPGSTGSFIIPEDNDLDAYAVFGQATFDITPQLGLTFGLRYSKEEKEDLTSVGAVFDLLGLESPQRPLVFSTRQVEDDWSDVTPEIGLEYQVNDDLLVYGKIAQGFKSGGFNAFDTRPSFDEEEITSFEAGFKSDLADRSLRLNGALFYYDYQDLQVSTFINGLTLTTNAAEATVWGGELELQWVPAAAPNVRVSGGLSILDAEYDRFVDRQGNNPDGTPRVLDLTGNTLPNAPDFKLNIGVEYDIEMAGGRYVTLSGQLSHQDDVFFTQFNEPVVGQDGVTLIDGRVAYQLSENFELALFGRNLADEDYFQNVVRFTSTSDPGRDPLGIGNALGYPAPGRTYGLQAFFRF